MYLELPTDLVFTKIPRGKLDTPLTRTPQITDQHAEDFVLGEIQKLVEKAGSEIIILVDACTIRHDVVEEVWDLIQRTGFPVYSAPMGKTAIPEDFERFGGVRYLCLISPRLRADVTKQIYVGSISHPEIKEKVESAKLVLSVGGLKSDFNTGNFTYRTSRSTTVEVTYIFVIAQLHVVLSPYQLHSDHTRVQYALYPGLGMKHLLPKLTARLHPLDSPASAASVPPFRAILPKAEEDPLGEETISHLYFWPRMSQFIRPEDVVVTETGTSSFGALEMPLPAKSIYLSQILWGSIGWATGATVGAALAARERRLKGRTLLFTGDGSLQLTAQELSTAMRHGLAPIVFVLNNRGYTIERHLHGKERRYNDIVNWYALITPRGSTGRRTLIPTQEMDPTSRRLGSGGLVAKTQVVHREYET